EHGGFYDHVPTPFTGIPSPDSIVGPQPYNFQFDRLGVRVPAILISPWIERGTVLHGPSGPYPTSEFEHSSIPATVKKIFNLKEFLTKRDEWAGTFEVVLNRTTPRTDCPVTLPEPVKMRETEPSDDDKNLSDFQQELVQLAAALRGDHKNGVFTNKPVDGMTVGEAVNYVDGSFRVFLDEWENSKNRGADESHIPFLEIPRPRRASKSFAQKIFSCLVCDN
ncbi:Non-specific phospholipase C3, partial [Sarracenia purpurea var. burkii]